MASSDSLSPTAVIGGAWSQSGADLEGGVGGKVRGSGAGTEVPQWGPEVKPRQGSGDGVPQKLEHFQKYTT